MMGFIILYLEDSGLLILFFNKKRKKKDKAFKELKV